MWTGNSKDCEDKNLTHTNLASTNTHKKIVVRDSKLGSGSSRVLSEKPWAL